MTLKPLRKKLTVPLLMYGGLLIFFFSTNPKRLPIAWLVLPFIWLFIALYLTFKLIFSSFIRPERQRRIRALSIIMAMLPTIVLLLDSVNQLSIRDVLLLMALGLVGLFYSSKIDLIRP